MKRHFWFLMVAGTGLLAACTSRHNMAAKEEPQTSGATVRTVGYDDRQIARIHRGETTEAQLLQCFGYPETREVGPDGRARLSWSFLHRTDGGLGGSGILNVSLGPDGKVEAYSARGGSASEKRTVEFVEKSDTDMREHMEQWRREGWSVLSVSARLPQVDGTVHRKAELQKRRSGTAAGFGYDDRRLAQIRRGETTGAQFLEWFGPAHSRRLQPDGRAQLSWTFVKRVDGGPGNSGELNASFAPDGKVDSYSARRGPY